MYVNGIVNVQLLLTYTPLCYLVQQHCARCCTASIVSTCKDSFPRNLILNYQLRSVLYIYMAPRQGRSVKKVATNELKLRRLQENNHRLQEELDRPRTVVSLASMRCVRL